MRAFVVLSIFLVGATAHARVPVVATLPDLAAIAQEVGGGLVDVTTLATPTEDPHYVDPKPNLILPLNRAELLVVNGLDLEIGWLPTLLVSARNRTIQAGQPGYFDASLYVQRHDVPTGKLDRSMGDVHPGGNPHYTYDPRQVARIATALAERLSQIDPAHASKYAQGAARFNTALHELAAAETQRFAALSEQSRRVVTYHASMTYLIDWLGLTLEATIEPRPGISPDPAHVATVLGRIRAGQAKAILQEEHHPRSTSRTLAKLGEVPLVVVPTATRFNEGQTYLTHMRIIVKELYRALVQ